MTSQLPQGVVPPPEGVTPNLVNPPNQLGKNIAIHTVFLALSTFAVAMRVYTRLYVSRVKLGVDDYLCILAYCAIAAWSGVMFMAFRWGVGRNLWDQPSEWIVPALKFEAIAGMMYLIAATLIKLSLLFLYHRLFSLQKRSKWLVVGSIVVVSLFSAGVLLGTIFQCVLVQKARDDSLPGYCSPPAIFLYLSGAWNAVVDIYVLILPLHLIRSLNLTPKRKLRLTAVFSLGAPYLCGQYCSTRIHDGNAK
ncbi:hypothetical protein GGR52DRAFT_4258 [Hypoxylon sp. FL1284]|nr:hypothetical protein GGR52DRAFT_4258 [Hypoxylon sp. FL1284]